jgi:hypothetical protein
VTPADAEVFEVLADWAVTLPATILLIRRDERRLQGARLERSWPPSSRDGAILGLWLFGLHPLAIAIHWMKTRASVRGCAVGVALFLVIEALGIGAATVVQWLAVGTF